VGAFVEADVIPVRSTAGFRTGAFILLAVMEVNRYPRVGRRRGCYSPLQTFSPRKFLRNRDKQVPNEAPFDPSAQFPAFQIRFVRVPAGVREAGWHTPLGRVLAVWLDGVVEFETSDGELRRVSAGGFLLVEDTRGKGHISRHPLERQSVILVTLPSGLDLPSR
jgi:hypothetical protein